MEEPSKPVPNIVLRRCPLGERGHHHSLSFLNRSNHFSISFPFGVPGLVRFLLLSTQFSVFVRDLRGRRSRIHEKELLCSKNPNGSEEELDYRLMLERLGQ